MGLFLHKIGAIFEKRPKQRHSVFQYPQSQRTFTQTAPRREDTLRPFSREEILRNSVHIETVSPQQYMRMDTPSRIEESSFDSSQTIEPINQSKPSNYRMTQVYNGLEPQPVRTSQPQFNYYSINHR
mmetsp:Transcript_25232/g.25001  ORF Transcript_25232/g.25001 Transcript_25232/m.25001 type:complete len:127 (-) Transcript_25232:6-386(-)